ncbi:AraC family transcriptional regulator ligand-binding domain-containing protein [Vibrio methylphosphonaticus]|uniref:AraC family transcriptional regulator ligand-binding domain-containing protein n=1 Tax=Vibrio methylphosphonaticus TaxID=2946866 RepID=UPI0038732195
MDIAKALGSLAIENDYNHDTLKNLKTLFRRYQLTNSLSIHIDELLLSKQDIGRVALRQIQKTSIENMLQAGHSDAGFALGGLFNVASFGAFNIALQSAPNLASSVRLISQYAPQFEAILKIHLCEDTSRLYIGFSDDQSPLAWQYEDALMACWQMLTQLAQTQLTPRRVSLQAPAKKHSIARTSPFSVDIEFNAQRTFIELPKADWLRSIGAPSSTVTSLFESWAVHSNQENMMWLSELYRTIYEQLSRQGKPVNLTLIANQSHCSIATVKRRLAKHDKTLTQMKDEVAMLVSYHYITMTTLPFLTIADWLGFSDSANFCRACKRWFRTTPSALRNATSATTMAKNG